MKPYYIFVLVIMFASHWSYTQDSSNVATYLGSIKMGLN